MSIVEQLNNIMETSESHIGSYGLTQYLDDNNESPLKNVFEKINEIDSNINVCVDFPLLISKESTANRIIHYKDVFKIPEGCITIPYILYWEKGDQQRAIVISNESYLEAKGMYFCLTEREGQFNESRNEILALYADEDDIYQAFNDLYNGKKTVGATQRSFDAKYYSDSDDAKDKAVELCNGLFARAKEEVLQVKDRSDIIYQTIGKAFLLKKFVYVQYMMNKDLLANRHEGDVKKQRQFARAYADELPITSFSELWRYQKAEE